MYYYDFYGWQTDEAMPGRGTELKPPAPSGQKRPNWTGFEWVLQTYVAPPPPVPPSPPVPASVTPRQARRALNAVGMLDNVDAALSQLPEPQQTEAKIDWEYATSVDRSSPLVANLGAALGLDADDLDVLFLQAATL